MTNFHLPTFLKTFVASLAAAAIASPKFAELKTDLYTVGVCVVLAGIHALMPSAPTV